MRSMAMCYENLGEKLGNEERDAISFINAVDGISDEEINKEFVWLSKHYRKGLMRHIGSTDTNNSNAPLANKNGKASEKPTRISKIIKRTICQTYIDNISPGGKNYWVPSPLLLVEEILSSPNSPSFSAYILYAIRTYLFFKYKSVPSGLLGKSAFKSFTEEDLQKLYSSILTSTVSRFESQGKDTLVSQLGAGGVLQQYLAYRNILVLSFRSLSEATQYFSKRNIIPDNRQRIYQKNSSVARMPEIARIVNELWGVPIPIRGADTVFHGGLKLSSKRGLVIAIHGGPGTGKTSLSLALCGALEPYGIQTTYISAEEQGTDLKKRSLGLFSDDMKRLPFFSTDSKIKFEHVDLNGNHENSNYLDLLGERLSAYLQNLKDDSASEINPREAVPKSCRAILVLDGLHDLFIGAKNQNAIDRLKQLHKLVDDLQKLQAIVILTIADDWEAGSSLDYMVDIALRLSFTEVEAYDTKPDRRITLFKARHQQCAFGTHGLQISGDKGVRFSPQINHQLDRRAIWNTRLPDNNFQNPVFQNAYLFSTPNPIYVKKNNLPYVALDKGVKIPKGSNIFINGNGSGGKAGLAMRIAFTPVTQTIDSILHPNSEKVLIISFLYPRAYYSKVLEILNRRFKSEYRTKKISGKRLEVIHLYPGYLKPNDLYNRIDWEIQSAERVGEPYTSVIVDGLHNVFLQFPEIQKYPIFWPQLYNALRSRPLNIITTHTTLIMQDDDAPITFASIVDDDRSEPLRHALVQKTDFQLTVERIPDNDSGLYAVKFLSAIGQKVDIKNLFWERETLTLFQTQQKSTIE